MCSQPSAVSASSGADIGRDGGDGASAGLRRRKAMIWVSPSSRSSEQTTTRRPLGFTFSVAASSRRCRTPASLATSAGGGAQHLGVAAIGAGGQYGASSRTGVEGAGVLPLLGRDGDDLGLEVHALEILAQALQPRLGTVQGDDLVPAAASCSVLPPGAAHGVQVPPRRP